MGWHSGFEKTCICNTIRPLTTQYEDSLHQFESCTAHHPKPLKPHGFKGFCCLKTGLTLILTLKAPAHRRYAPCGAWLSPAWCRERGKARKRLRQMLHRDVSAPAHNAAALLAQSILCVIVTVL